MSESETVSIFLQQTRFSYRNRFIVSKTFLREMFIGLHVIYVKKPLAGMQLMSFQKV